MKQYRWIRFGECKRCGKCCYMHFLATAPIMRMKLEQDDPNLLKFLETDAGKVIRCIHFEYNEKGEGVCKLFNTDKRFQACIDHPSSPLSITEGCTAFTFVKESLEDEEEK